MSVPLPRQAIIGPHVDVRGRRAPCRSMAAHLQLRRDLRNLEVHRFALQCNPAEGTR